MMIDTNKTRLTAILCLVMALAVLPLCAAHASKSNLDVIGSLDEDPIVDIMLGKAEMVEIGGAVSDVLVADPSIVDVMAVKSNRLYLVGASLGDTNIIALDAEGNIVEQLDIHVQMDTRKLEDMIGILYPNETVEIRALTDQLVLTGEVSTPAVANRIANMVAQYAAEIQEIEAGSVDEVITNLMNVRGEQQVMLRVKIVEASRNALKELGIEADLNNGTSGNFGATLATAAGLGLSAPQQLATLALNYTTGNFGPLSLMGRALEEEGIVNTLAEPNLTAISGEQAGFLAGGEFPIPTELDQNGNLVYEFRPFGVSLNFRPVVMSENRISMQLTTEVSTTSFDQNLQLQGINVPTFNVRRAETTVELPSGGTLMIAGLLQSDTISGLTQLPGIGDVPVIGDLMKSDTFARDESEVVVMITPYLVQPFALDRSSPSAQPVTANYDGSINHANVEPVSMDGNHKMPDPVREDSKVDKIFQSNIKRTYGNTAPKDLMSDSKSFGYIMD